MTGRLREYVRTASALSARMTALHYLAEPIDADHGVQRLRCELDELWRGMTDDEQAEAEDWAQDDPGVRYARMVVT